MSPRRQGKRVCVVCVTAIRPDDDVVVMMEVGEVHAECEQEIERGIEEGGCDRGEYLRLLGLALTDEDDEFPEFGTELGKRRAS